MKEKELHNKCEVTSVNKGEMCSDELAATTVKLFK